MVKKRKNIRVVQKKFNMWWASTTALAFLVAIVLFFKALDVKVGGFISTNATTILILTTLVIVFSGYSLKSLIDKTKKRYMS